MPLVAPTICRFTIDGQFGDQEVANILDMQVDTTGSIVSREEGLFRVAGDILNNWTDHILSRVTSAYRADSVRWLDLNTADGPTGERSTTSDKTWPQNGVDSAAPLPANVAGLVKKQIVGTRGRRSGRMYVAGLSEAATGIGTPNVLSAAVVDDWNTQLDLFLQGINDEAGIDNEVTRKLVVVHTQQPDPDVPPSFNGYSDVDSLIMEPLLATQRRRLR